MSLKLKPRSRTALENNFQVNSQEQTQIRKRLFGKYSSPATASLMILCLATVSHFSNTSNLYSELRESLPDGQVSPDKAKRKGTVSINLESNEDEDNAFH